MTEISQTTTDLIYAEQWGLLADEVGIAVAQSFRFGCEGPFELAFLKQRVSDHKIEMARCPITAPKGLNKGDFTLGFNQHGVPLRCPFKYMGSPSLIVGSTGSGKTTAARFWCLQAGMLCRGAWFIDARKREMRMLQPHFAQQGLSLAIIDARDMKINPLEVPEGISPQSFSPNVADSLMRVLQLPPVARKVLHQSLHVLYQKHGILDGNTVNYPTLFELRDLVCNAKAFHTQARDAFVTALDPMLLSLKRVLAFRKGWNVNELATRRIVFECNSCSESEKNLLTEALLLPEFQLRVARGLSNVAPSLAIYVDEGSSLIESSDATISQWIGLIRGVGLSLLISNQSAVSISQRVLSNIPNRFLGQCSSFADLNVMASALGLSSQQKKYLAVSLRPGLLLGSLGQGVWRHPFLFTMPLLENAVPEQRGSNSANDDLQSLPVVAAPEFDDWEPDWVKREFIPPSAGTGPTDQIPDSVDGPQSDLGLEANELRLLRAIASEPCKPVSFYPAEIRMSKRTVARLRKSLLEKNLIQEQHVQTSGRGRPSILLALTPHASKMLGAE